jgi:hypothetical protein
VREEEDVLAEKLQPMVPELLPLTPEVIESQELPEVTAAVQGMVPAPVLETLKEVVPAPLVTFWLVGVTDNVGAPACVTVTLTGLPVAPLAVTVMVAVREEEDVLAEKLQPMVPELLPLTPEVIESQELPEVTAAVQGIVPVPVLETLKEVVPALSVTFWLVGVTDKTD